MFNRLRLVKRPLTSSLPCLCVCILIRGQTYTNQQSSELSAKCRTVASLGCSHDPIHDINLHLLPIIWRIILTCISIHFSSDLLNTGLSFFYCPDGGRHRRGLYLCRYEHYAADKVIYVFDGCTLLQLARCLGNVSFTFISSDLILNVDFLAAFLYRFIIHFWYMLCSYKLTTIIKLIFERQSTGVLFFLLMSL